jgi:hypothetical protein
MRAVHLVPVGIAFVLLFSGSRWASADVCPEPNDAIASACFLGPDGTAAGSLASAEDVDLYKVELPANRMLVARLAPGGYELQLMLPDGKAGTGVTEASPTERTLKVDGLTAGPYYLKVFAPGGIDPNQPYEVSVSYPPALALPAPGAVGGQPTVTSNYVPPPASQYPLRLEEVGPGFHEVCRDEPEGGRLFYVCFHADDVQSFFGAPVSATRVGRIQSYAEVFDYGSENEVQQRYDAALAQVRDEHGGNVQPVVGWGSERAMTYSWRVNTGGFGPSPYWARGILLKHQNAWANTTIEGWEQFTTWDRIAQLAKKVEDRILAASK